MDLGKYVRELKLEFLYDSIRKKWVERFIGVNVVGFYEIGINFGEELVFLYFFLSKKDKQLMGWVFKMVKKLLRMEVYVKVYLVQKFEIGCRIG